MVSLTLALVALLAGVRNWVQTWGGGERGQLGQGKLIDSWKPRTVRQLLGTAPVDVAFGYSHALALTFGQARCAPARTVTNLTPCTCTHIAHPNRAAATAQEMYSWGQATFGQLGRAIVDNSSGIPREVVLPTPQIISDLQVGHRP